MHRPVKTFDHEYGVSEIIGAIMLISVVVIAISVIGVFITSQGMPEKVPALSATISVSGDTITLHHDGGDSLSSSQLSFIVDGSPVSPETFTKNGQPWTTWGIGETLAASGLGETPGVVNVVYTAGSSSVVLSRADFTQGVSGVVTTTTTTPTTTVTPTTTTTTPIPTPTFGSISPDTGPAAGDQSVTITGTGFTGATAVTFGGTAAGSFSVDSDTQISATTPAHAAGSVDVVITAPGGTATGTGAYTYIATPTFSGVSPDTGPAAGGQSVTITGTGFTGATAVTFGGTAAGSFSVDSDTQISATTPAHAAGSVDVVITAPGGTATGTGAYTYIAAPTFSGISPDTGSSVGGTSVTITGTGFTGATAVTFGGSAAASYSVDSATSISAVTPFHLAGPVDVVITTPYGTATGTNAFTYYTIQQFTSVGTTTWTVPSGITTVEYLVVAGGGGGGYYGGGGGAGGMRTGTFAVSGSSYLITIGGGGAGATSSANGGSDGGASSIGTTVTTTGGGGGGSNSGTLSIRSGRNGGSGGGGIRSSTPGGTGVSGEGNNGGSGYTNTNYWGGGGGGASAAGANAANSLAGAGGAGDASSITGVSVTYAGGGGGGCRTGTAGTGGDGGGGNGGTNNVYGSDATGYGSGGGGGGRNRAGGDGSSGIVIIKYY